MRGMKPDPFRKFYANMFGEIASYNNEVAVYLLLKLLEKLDVIENP
jgi:hypothetical protein